MVLTAIPFFVGSCSDLCYMAFFQFLLCILQSFLVSNQAEGENEDFSELMSDPAFLQSVMENLPGVDISSEAVRDAMGTLTQQQQQQQQSEEKKKDETKPKDKK